MTAAATITCGWQARLYPTPGQAARLNQWAGALRFLWNRLLEREKAEHAATGRFLWRKGLQTIAVGMKRQPGLEWLADLPAHAVLDTAIRLDAALRRMVNERKAGRKCGFPKPKKKFVRESGIYCVGQATSVSAREATVPKLGKIKLRGGDSPEGRLLAARIVRDGDRWMLSAQFECARPEPLSASGMDIGVDVGLRHLATVHDGADVEHVAAPKPLAKAMKRLKRLQRAQSRRRKGSARRRAAAKRVANLHRRVANKRRDFNHQLSHRLTTKGDCIGIETLNIAAMARGLRLGKALADAGLGQLLGYVRHKADWRGRFLHAADRWRASTKPCSVCGLFHDMPLGKRTLRCECGNVMDRDANAAANLRRYAQEAQNRAGNGPTRGEIGEQVAGVRPPPVPVVEPRMMAIAGHHDHESQ